MTSLGTAIGLGTKAALLFGTVTGKLLGSVALSALQAALTPKPREPGIRQTVTATGGTNPVSLVLGRYATGGYSACPAMSHGKVGKTPNAYLTYVVDLSDIPGMTLDALILDGEVATIGTTAHADYGLPIEGRFAGYAWIKYYNGSQTAADPMLLAKYGSYPQRPWTADMIGRGLCYAILTFRLNRKIFTAFPAVRFVVSGIPLYDPRQDSMVGGSGAHRWGNAATYVPSSNPMVQAYNVMRGISLPDGTIWGGDASAPDLPLADWFAAMNACDVAVPLAGGGTEPKYRAGFEVTLSDEPAAILEELLKSCAGSLVDMGGVWKPRVGGAGLPVYVFSDADVIISRPQDYDPFHGIGSTYNGVTASFPDPNSLWESREAPPRYNAGYEADDGGRRLVASLSLPAVPYAVQVQRLQDALIKDERRMRRHGLTLPPSATVLEPMDSVAWTSARNGYLAKTFELSEVVDDLQRCLQSVGARECDPTDYNWSVGSEIAFPPVTAGIVLPAAQEAEGFDLLAHTITDAGALDRRPALRLTWNGSEQDGVTAIEYEVRVAATAVVIKRGVITDVNAGELILAEGILASTAYEARMRPVVAGPVVWTAWDAATTAAVELGSIDMDGSVVKAVLIGPVDIPTTIGYTFLSISVGQIDPHQLWTAGVSAELKHTSGAAAVLAFERRYKFGGAWGPWIEAGTMTTTTVWDVEGVTARFAGTYENAEFRLVVKTNAGLRPLSLRNVYMTAINIVKA